MNKIILADNFAIFRAGILEILSKEAGFQVIARCRDTVDLQKALSSSSRVTVLFGSSIKQDVRLLMKQIRGLDGRGIAMLSAGEATQPYLAARVHGLFFRSMEASMLLKCIRCVGRGETWIASADDAGTIAEEEEDLIGARVSARLAPKEMMIVSLIMQGCKNKEIGYRLHTTEQAIKNHLRGVYLKAGVSDRLELALFAMHHRNLAEATAVAGNWIMNAA